MTYTEIKNKINELINRTGRAAIKVADVFGLMQDINEKMRDIDVSATATVAKSWETEALALADKNPINDYTNKPLKVGQLVSITQDTDNSKNAIYRLAGLEGDGTVVLEFQGKIGDVALYAKKTELSNITTVEYSSKIYPDITI